MINNIAFTFFGLDIYWYGIVYSLGFLTSYFFINYFAKDFGFNTEEDQKFLEDTFLWVLIISVIFGRVFHIVFYDLSYYLANLSEIIRFDKGGMSIHGGLFGASLVLYLMSKKHGKNLFRVSDLFVLPTAFWLGVGRIANFINQELVGKITTNDTFGVVFPKYDDQLRWPTTLFESGKNFLISAVLMMAFLTKKFNKSPGLLTAWFLILYNFLRFLIDFLREPDVLILGIISMGQFLSLIFGFFGIILLLKIRGKSLTLS